MSRRSAGAPKAPAKSRRASAQPLDASLAAAFTEIAANVRDLAGQVRRLPRFKDQQLFIEIESVDDRLVKVARRIEEMTQ